jgi:hypothetical protein
MYLAAFVVFVLFCVFVLDLFPFYLFVVIEVLVDGKAFLVLFP